MIQILCAKTAGLRLHAVLLSALIAVSATGAEYTFSGREGFSPGSGPELTGGISLDLGDLGVMTPLPGGENGSSAVYSSSNHSLFGSYDLWSFTGVPEVYVTDTPIVWSGGQENFGQDHWIVRTAVSGPAVGDWTPSFLGLYYYTSPASLTSSALQPPSDPLTSPNEYDLTFYLELSDGKDGLMSFSGPVFSVQSVPEPTTFSLISLGTLMLAFQCRRRSGQTRL